MSLSIEVWHASTVLAICAVLGVALYHQAWKRIPSRLDVKQAPKSPLGLIEAWPRSDIVYDTGTDVIFIHGLGSNPDTTWQGKSSATAKPKPTPDVDGASLSQSEWITDFLPMDLTPDLRKSTRLFFFNYDSYWKRDSVKHRLSSICNQLLGQIDMRIRTDNRKNRKLIFVTHSFGGLVIKQALVQAASEYPQFSEQVAAIIFLGCPHRGSNFAGWGRTLAHLLSPFGSDSTILTGLDYDSLSLLDLHEEFMRKSSPSMCVTNFFEQRPTRLLEWWILRWEKKCVEEQSARYPEKGSKNVPLGVDHYGLNKFSSRNAEYKAVCDTLITSLKAIGTTCDIYSVPFHTVSTFTPRQALARELRETMERNDEGCATVCAVAVSGLGGSGKTQLVLDFLQSVKDRFDPILWIDAKDITATRSSFERCARALRLQLADIQSNSAEVEIGDLPVVQAVLSWLQQRDGKNVPWMVVIDNVDDLTWGVNRIVPKNGHGNLIMTTRDSEAKRLLGSRCFHIHVARMEPTEAQSLLLQHVQKDAHRTEVMTLSSTIAKRLDYLSFALDLAGARISSEIEQDHKDARAAMEAYLAHFDKHRERLLNDSSYQGLSAYDKTVRTVWDTTLESLQRDNQDSVKLLQLLAFMDRTNIQDEIFRLASLGIGKVFELLDFDRDSFPKWFMDILEGGGELLLYKDVRRPLIRYHLLQQAQAQEGWDGVAMHALVQWRIVQDRDDTHTGLFVTFITAVLVQMNADYGKPEFRRHLVSHLGDLSELVRCCHYLGEEDQSSVLTQLANLLYEEGRWKEAEELELQVIETGKRVHCKGRPGFLEAIITIASINRYHGRREAALGLRQRVAEPEERVLVQEHPSTLHRIANLATTYWKQGQWEKAEELEVQVLETRKRVLGQEHPDTLSSMNNLALTYHSQDRWKEAEELAVQVLETRKKVLGQEHPDTFFSMNNLASTYWDQGQWEKAEELQVEVKEMRKRVLGQEHPDTLISMNNLASTYHSQDRWKEAEELKMQVLETRKRVLGREHPDTLISMANLSITWKSQGKHEEALHLMKTCADLRRRILGPDHLDTRESSETVLDWENSTSSALDTS